MSNIQRLVHHGSKRSSAQDRDSRLDPLNDSINRSSPLDSLRSQKHEEFSCKECLFKGLGYLFDFTIASCNYAFCTCIRKKRRSGYENLELETDASTCSVNGGQCAQQEIENMKGKLRFHFMNPFQKWKHDERRRFPWKLLTQLLALIVVTTQLWINATQKFQLNSFVSENVDTFEQLFVMNPQPSNPTVDYYHTSATSVIITKDDFWSQLNYTAYRYYNIRELAVGPFGYQWQKPDSFNNTYIPEIKLYVEHYKKGEFVPEIKSYSFRGDKQKDTFNVTDPSVTDIVTQFEGTVLENGFDSIISMSMEFYLSSVYLDAQSSPLCCQFQVMLQFMNRIHSGSMPVSLTTDTIIEGCSKNVSSYDPATGIYDHAWTTGIDSGVLVLMVLSTIQCVRSILTTGRFTKKVRNFFRNHYEYKLSLSQYLPLYNWWFVGVVISNFLVTVGTILFLLTSYKEVHHLEVDDVVAIIYGMGVFLQWCGLLRFLSYFDKYNILLITLRLALPSVIRFMVCGFIFYVAFLLLGWLVLSPYHPKFRDPSVTSECLFSLINGDDMFNTYIQMENLSLPAFIFSKVYLYVFISLFIYVVLSVFISLISDTYETLHEEWSVRSKGLLWDFAYDRSCRTRQESESQYEVLTGSVYSTDNNHLITNGGPLLSHVTNTSSRRGTPVLQLPVSNPNSPRVTGRQRSTLYPNLETSNRPQIIIDDRD